MKHVSEGIRPLTDNNVINNDVINHDKRQIPLTARENYQVIIY